MKPFVVLLTLMPALTFAQTPAAPTTAWTRLIGVYDAQSGRPIEGVEVRDLGTGMYVTTSETGTATLAFISGDSSARVALRKLGYRRKEFILRAGATSAITELLDPLNTLPTIRTTTAYRLDADPGDRAGFERRCHQGSRTVVTCLRHPYFADRPTYSLADLLKLVPGVHVSCSGAGTSVTGTASGSDPSMSPCRIDNACDWYIDGFRFKPFPRQSSLTYAEAQRQLTASRIENVEVYFNDGPMKYYDPAVGCAFVIWTTP